MAITRRSMARASNDMPSTNSVITTRLLINAQRLNTDLPGSRSTWSSADSSQSKPPTSSMPIASQMSRVMRRCDRSTQLESPSSRLAP